MRKVSLVLAMVLLLSMLAVPTMAAEPRIVTIIPSIAFEGTTAKCGVSMVGNMATDELEATIRLYRGNTLIATWYAEGNGYIFFSKEKVVTKGYNYKLTVDLTINGEACSQVYEEAYC